MDKKLKAEFLDRWNKYFKGADLPFAFFFSNDEGYAGNLRPVQGYVCMIGQLAPVLKGKTVSFTGETIGCFGGIRYAGFPAPEFPGFKYFLSCGIPGEHEGERYKKTPDLVEQYVKDMPAPQAQGKYFVFKRWDRLDEDDDPQAVIFFATPDVLARHRPRRYPQRVERQARHAGPPTAPPPRPATTPSLTRRSGATRPSARRCGTRRLRPASQ
jgi:hypothetical protein